jgi:hypothetical protein
MMPATAINPTFRTTLEETTKLLRKYADYTLPVELDQRMLALGENKEFLTEAEKQELAAWVRFVQERSLEKYGAMAALSRLESEMTRVAAA